MHEQVNQSPANTRLDNGLYFIVGTVGQVGDGPASIDENFVVKRVNELGQDGQSGRDLVYKVVRKANSRELTCDHSQDPNLAEAPSLGRSC